MYKNYYYNLINSTSSTNTLILYGKSITVSWEQRLKTIQKYLKKIYAYHVIKKQQDYNYNKINDETLYFYYKYYYTTLSLIEKDFVSYFIQKEKLLLQKEKQEVLNALKKGSINQECANNRVNTLKWKNQCLEEVEQNKNMSLKFAITKAEHVIVKVLNKNINLNTIDAYISDQNYNGLVKELEYVVSEYEK